MPSVPGSTELATPICGRTHSTTSTRTKEPWEELVTYCLATKQSEVTVQHRPGLMSLVVEETDDTLHPPSPLPRGRSRGHVTLSSQDPGTMTRSAATQEAGPTEQGRWSVNVASPEAQEVWAADQGTVQNYTEAKGSCPSKQVKIPRPGSALSQFSGFT